MPASWVAGGALLLAAAVAVPGVAPAEATDSGPLLLRSHAATASWSGHFADAGAGVSSPETCLATDCDIRELSLELPPHQWYPDGGLQVGIRWPDEEQDVDLFVYGPQGDLVGRSDGFFASTAESVLVPAPRNGPYQIVVVPRSTHDLRYEGIAQLERGNIPVPAKELLPDLVALPARNASFATGAFLFSKPTVTAGGCYPDEAVEHGAARCLRFDQIVANAGAGPLELRYDLPDATSSQLRQRVYRSDGSWRERAAGAYEFHATHAHFHYRNFAISKLWASDDRGRKLGREPVRVGRKNGFCVVDIENIWFGRHGDAARSYFFPHCVAPTVRHGVEPVLRQGMSVGWADVYNWFLPGQYIEVTGVADGYYLLETVADADELVLETNEVNNSSWTLIRICGDAAEVVGQQSNCG